MSHVTTSARSAFEILHSTFTNGSGVCGAVRVARTGKDYGFTILPDGRTRLTRGVNTIRPDHLRDVRHFVLMRFADMIDSPAAAAPANETDRAAITAQALDGAYPFIGHRPEGVHAFLAERGYRASSIPGLWARDGAPSVNVQWHAGDSYGYVLSKRAVVDVEASAPEAEQLTAPGLAHADEWRTRRSTWIPLSVALAAALASFLPGTAGAAPFDPGFARAGADPASNALALALWCLLLACAAGCVLAFAGRPRRVRRERDAEALRVRCRRVTGA